MEDQREKELQAQEVYLLMKKDYRISRNIRASWFFQHLNQCLKFTPEETLVDTADELQVASVVTTDDTQFQLGTEYHVRLVPGSAVTFVARRYRFVIILDLSPSVISVDTNNKSVVYEQIHKTLSNFLHGVVLPFKLPGSEAVLTPEIHITVIAYSPVKTFTFNQVLAQGVVVNESNIEQILSSLEVKLTNFETTLADNFSSLVESHVKDFASSYCDVRPSVMGVDPGSPLPKENDIIDNPEAGIVNMIRCGLIALQLLPENSSAGLVVITDGCLGVPDANLFEFLLTQLRTSTIACSFLRVGNTRSPFGHFGHIPHTELMQFIATASFGSYFDTCPYMSSDGSYRLNAYHKAMFLWSFQRGLEGFRFDLGDQHLMTSPSQLVQKLLSHPIHGKHASVMPNIRKRQQEKKLNTSLFSILSVRLREGYTIREVAITKGETQIEVRLVLPWREYARFEYLVRASWPLNQNRPVTHTEITIEGSYDFLHDMTCTKINTQMMSGFRSANVRKFWQALQGLSQTDQLLMHLHSFSSNPVYYTLPENIKEGVPLFYLPQLNSTTPALSTQLNSRDPVLNQFASYWKPVVNLDITVWQKWMHTHRIGIVLEHDIPVHKNIHIPNSSGRFSVVLCRHSTTSLNLFLTEWSTFVLLDGQTYIRLIYDDTEDKTKPPVSFVIIRITAKSPCVVLRLAFLGGTAGYRRYELVKELRSKVAQLQFPQRGPKTDSLRRRTALKKTEETPRKAPLLREWAEIFCCVMVRKPVESILIRYEKMPHDMSKLEDHQNEVSHFMFSLAQTKKRQANLFNSLSRYLQHHRWIWTLQKQGINSISMQGVGRILSTLAKMRLQQGFHFGLTGSGIVNLMLEVEMKDPDVEMPPASKSKVQSTCVVQYILFPPYVKTTSEGLSDDDGDLMESPEDEGELQIITECWVEPQHGVSLNNPPEREQFDGLRSNQLADTFFPLDLKCISSLLSFEHLMYLCQNAVIPADLSQLVNTQLPISEGVTSLSSTIKLVDFPFDLLTLLPCCQQAELIYPIYTIGEDPSPSPDESPGSSREANDLLLNLLFDELETSCHRDVLLNNRQSKCFLNHLTTRNRSQEFPFDIMSLLQDNEEEAKTSHTKQGTDQKQYLSVPPQSFTHNASPRSRTPSPAKAVPGQVDEKFPKWRCFIKAVNLFALTLTFVPASYADLVLLHKHSEKSKTEVKKSATNEEKESSHPEPKDCSEAQAKDALPNSAADARPNQSAMSLVEKCPNADGHKTIQSCDGQVGQSAENSDKAEADTEPTDEQPPAAEEAAMNAADSKEIPRRLNHCLPVYVYDCIIHNVLDSLINPWDFHVTSDLYHDMTFDLQNEASEGTMDPSSPKMKRVAFSVDSIKDEEDINIRSAWRSHERRSTEGSNEGGENLWQHCNALSEMYYNCYVRGVFQSLQNGYTIESEDVDGAINNICEESLPLETNMTMFLHSSCAHMQQIVQGSTADIGVVKEGEANEERVEMTDGQDTPTLKRISVRFIDLLDDNDAESPEHIIPLVLKLPHVSMTFDLPSVHFDLPCEPIKGLHSLVKNKFQDIVQKWFRAVPSNQDYYFYCPETLASEELDERETTTSDGPHVIVEGADLPEADKLQPPRNDRASNTSMVDSEESMEDDLILDLDLKPVDKSDETPLFINFTCTVKSGLQQHSITLRNMAACLGELGAALENFNEINLGDLKVTFDLNCLTLPSDFDALPRKPSLLRMFSNSSLGGNSSEGSSPRSGPVSEMEDRSSFCHGNDLKHLKDPLGHLPANQRDAVNKCMEEIEWLLHDEIVSNLRHLTPIRGDALEYVAQHIHTTSQLMKPNTKVESVSLQFVFGPDKSLELFEKEFQKMKLQSYLLMKEHMWYYLSKMQVYDYMDASLDPLLVDLAQTHDPAALESLQTSADRRKSDTSTGARSELPQSVDSKYVKNLSPLVLSQRENMFDVGNDNVTCSSPLTLRADGQSKVDGSSEGGLEMKVGGRGGGLTMGLNVDNISEIHKRISKESMLRRSKESTDSLSESGRRKSSGAEVGSDGAVGWNVPTSPETGSEFSPISLTSNVSGDQQSFQVTPVSRKDSTDKGLSSLEHQSSLDTPVRRDSLIKKNKGTASVKTSPTELSGTTSQDVLSHAADVTPRAHCIDSASSTTGSPFTSAVQSPLLSDISIQLTKIDGQSETFRPDNLDTRSQTNESFDSLDMHDEGVLKRCSSFAGFRSKGSSSLELKIAHSEFTTPVKVTEESTMLMKSRLRHSSAPMSGSPLRTRGIFTQPTTPSCISSRGSLTEDGAYDGDMSEMDDTEPDMTPCLLPNFWLIMKIHPHTVDLLYQHRETGQETKEELLLQRNLLSQVRDKVEKMCLRVNQQLLLNNLFETRNCHNLLVDADDEDISWRLDRGSKKKAQQSLNVSSSENEDDDDMFERKYLAAAMDLEPGHFHCPCIWKTYFTIHPGLKRGAGGRGNTMSIGLKTIRGVLRPFQVENRTNLFVTKEDVTDNVYYIRLKEVQTNLPRGGINADDSSDAVSLSSGLKRELSDTLLAPVTPDRDPDTMSMGSTCSLSLTQSSRFVHDAVELSLYGIQEAGKAFRENLVTLLQKRLNEATFERVYEMLRRNPQCQLEKEDVLFIQKSPENPSSSLHLTVSNRASPYLGPIMYYLRQNLLLFLHTPRYKASAEEFRFQDMFDGRLSNIPTDQSFLHIPPHKRGTGETLAVISLCLVDGRGNQVKLLKCPRPMSQAYLEIESSEDLESFLVTQTYTMSPTLKGPGPTALIQFHIWQCDESDLSYVKERLTQTLKHALCDVVMEYYVLTAPLCEIPKHLLDLPPPPPTLSAPTSPFHCMPDETDERRATFYIETEEFRERKFSMVTLKKSTKDSNQRNLERRPSLQSLSRLQSLKEAFLQSTKKVMSPPPTEMARTFDLPKSDLNLAGLHSTSGPALDRATVSSSSPCLEPGRFLTQYECGERGTLHHMYADLMQDWFKHCIELDMPAVSRQELKLRSRLSIDYILTEFQAMVSRLTQGMTARVYKMLPTDEPCHGNIGVLYGTKRHQHEMGRRRSDSALECLRAVTLTPGDDLRYVCLARNLSQWYKFVQKGMEEEEIQEHSTRGKQTAQKFAAYTPSSTEGKSFSMFTETPAYIPRQRFIMLIMHNKQLTLYSYNLSNEVLTTLCRQLTKLVDWNNGRCHLLSSVVLQKCGLFSHCLFGEMSHNMEKIIQHSESLDQLIHNTAPPHINRDKEKLSRTHSTLVVRESYLPFDSTFKDLCPSKPLHLSHLACQSDPVRQYGQQAQDIRHDYRKAVETLNNIRTLYVMWVQKTAQNLPISESIMNHLKQSSRLFHYCATPLLFSSRWRHNVLEKYRVTRQDSVSSTVSSTATPDTKSRSRHGSGTSTGSVRTKRTDSSDMKKRPSLPNFRENNGTESHEEAWHVELRSQFLDQYINYLLSVGFNLVQMDKDKGKQPNRSGKPDEAPRQTSCPAVEETVIKVTDTHNLQKTVSGGVILIELSFRQEYFCVKLFTCDHNKLGITVNQQKFDFCNKTLAQNIQDLKLLFVDECEKCKELIHVHSFAHDFHLRCIQSYISGQVEMFKPGYFLSGLLNDFFMVYPYAPNYSRNFLQRDVITIPEPSCTSHDLYDYMLKHARLHNMSILRMVSPLDHDADLDLSHSKNCEHALISHESLEVDSSEGLETSKKRLESYNIGLVIVQDSPDDAFGERTGQKSSSLGLQFFIILTSSREIFPRDNLEKDLSVFMTASRTSVSDTNLKDKLKVRVKATSHLDRETTNYLGFSNKHHSPMYQLLTKEAIEVRSKIKNMAVVSMDKCRRDLLWDKMLISPATDDHSSKKRSDTDDLKDQFRRLTFDEFRELIDRVHKVPLHEMDDQLVPFLHMNHKWYQGLAQVLNTKYPKNVKRCFTNPENASEQHHVDDSDADLETTSEDVGNGTQTISNGGVRLGICMDPGQAVNDIDQGKQPDPIVSSDNGEQVDDAHAHTETTLSVSKGGVRPSNWKDPGTAVKDIDQGKQPDPIISSDDEEQIILNPKFLDLCMMLSVDNVSGQTGLFAVFRKPAKEQESICPGGQNIPEQNVQQHMEQFIETCCFHLWGSML